MAMTRPISKQVTFTQEGAGAVERLASEKLREWVSVKDFGAVGDGVTDTTVAIQAAINHASAYGIGLNTGTSSDIYLISDISIPDGVTFYGDGVLRGTVTGGRPSRADLTSAASAVERTALLNGYYKTTITVGATINGALTVDSVVIRGTASLRATGYIRLINSASDTTALAAYRNGVINCHSIILTGINDAALTAEFGGTILAGSAIITHCYRGIRGWHAGSIKADSAQIYNSTNAAVFLQFGGSVDVSNAVIDTFDFGGLINNYGGDFYAENITIKNGNAGAVIIESNGSAYCYRATIDNCRHAFSAFLGGFIQAREAVVTNTTYNVGEVGNDGYVAFENAVIDSSNTASTLFTAQGTGMIEIAQPGVAAGLATLSPNCCNPPWNSVGRGSAYIGPNLGAPATADFAGLTVSAQKREFLTSIGLVRTFSLQDDTAKAINLGGTVTAGIISFVSSAASAGAGIFQFRAAASPYIYALSERNTVTKTTGVLTGTTGPDGSVAISAASTGMLYFENRTGTTLTVSITLLQATTSVTLVNNPA